MALCRMKKEKTVKSCTSDKKHVKQIFLTNFWIMFFFGFELNNQILVRGWRWGWGRGGGGKYLSEIRAAFWALWRNNSDNEAGALLSFYQPDFDVGGVRVSGRFTVGVPGLGIRSSGFLANRSFFVIKRAKKQFAREKDRISPVSLIQISIWSIRSRPLFF